MRTLSHIASVFTLFALLIAASGCGSDSNAPDPAAETSATGTNAEEPTPGDDLEPPEGNTEPPLPDVTNAVDSVPEANGGTSEVSITAVSPDEFQAVLDKHKGKVVLVDFWATWCKPCVKGLPHTTELAHKNADRGLVVLTMAVADGNDADETADCVEKLKELKVDLENFVCKLGGGDETFDAYNIGDSGLPHYKLYDRDGSLVKEFRNDVEAGIAVSATDVDEHVEKLLAK